MFFPYARIFFSHFTKISYKTAGSDYLIFASFRSRYLLIFLFILPKFLVENCRVRYNFFLHLSGQDIFSIKFGDGKKTTPSKI